MIVYTHAGGTLKQTSEDLLVDSAAFAVSFVLRLQMPAGPPGADRHTASFRRPPNAFLSASICGWSAPLVSLPFICRFQRQRQHKQTKTLQPVLADAPKLRRKITLRRSERQSCWPHSTYRDMTAGVPIGVGLRLLASVSGGERKLIRPR